MKKSLLKKVVILLVVLSVIGVTLIGCGKKKEAANNSTAYETLDIKYQGWTGQVTIAELAEDLGYLKPLKLKWVGNTISGPQDIQSVATGDIDIGAAFGTAIVNLKASGAPITWVINSSGNDEKTYSEIDVLSDSPIKTASDLIGKKIAVNTLAAHNEILIKEYLKKNGLTDDDIKKVSLVVLPPVNQEQALRNHQVDAAVLGGLFKDKAYAAGGIRGLTSDYKTWGPRASSGLVINNKFIKNNPNTTKKLVEGIAKAIEWSKSTPIDQVRQRMSDIIKKRQRNENDSAIAYFKGYGVPEKGGLSSDKEIQLWIDTLVKNGSLKKDQIKPSDIYTNKFNPYNN
ncbi:MAG: ABC transporter substrate-binding protein [Clostridium sp.]|uniref:ABC transporter substrate-binding protein n=1 Tax=Clostridium sp. TaxID=1506 RepID=UPI0039E7DB6E